MKITIEVNSIEELNDFANSFLNTTAKDTPAPRKAKSEEPKTEVKEEPKAETPKAPKAPKTEKAKEEPKDTSDDNELDFAKDVAPLILKLAKEKGRDAAVSLLNSFGVEKGPELEPGQFKKFVAQAKAKLEED